VIVGIEKSNLILTAATQGAHHIRLVYQRRLLAKEGLANITTVVAGIFIIQLHISEARHPSNVSIQFVVL